MFTGSESQRSGLIILHLSLGTIHCSSLPYSVLQEACIYKFLIFCSLVICNCIVFGQHQESRRWEDSRRHYSFFLSLPWCYEQWQPPFSSPCLLTLILWLHFSLDSTAVISLPTSSGLDSNVCVTFSSSELHHPYLISLTVHTLL